jgi:ferritin-like metal-binding protein YciE
MESLIREGREILEPCDAGTGKKVERSEIPSYETLRQFAEMIGLSEAVPGLKSTITEEKATVEKRSDVAHSIGIEVKVTETKSIR